MSLVNKTNTDFAYLALAFKVVWHTLRKTFKGGHPNNALCSGPPLQPQSPSASTLVDQKPLGDQAETHAVRTLKPTSSKFAFFCGSFVARIKHDP